MLVRNTRRIETDDFDLLIIGGGIFGACAAWDATLRGLKVVLVEKEDFASGASANSFKMIHGGIRYMQHLDLARVRASCHERSAFLRIAPHLVKPIPIVMPTIGYGVKGKPFLAAGMMVYDGITLDRNAGISDLERQIPGSKGMSRAELLKAFPGLKGSSPTGAVVFNDAQMYNPTRLVLAFVQSAAQRGAVLMNYVAARKIRVARGKVSGCVVEDVRTGKEIEIRCRAILNAAGPWAEEILTDNRIPQSVEAPPAYSRDSCFVIKRRFSSEYALAVPGVNADNDALLSRSARHMFLVPWRDYTLVGVWHKIWNDRADAVRYDHDDLLRHLNEINQIYPGLELKPSDVLMWNAGLLPFGNQDAQSDDLSFGKQSSIVDHEKEHGIAGLVSLIGVRYTMGRVDAGRAIDLLLKKSRKDVQVATDQMPVFGGDIANFGDLVQKIRLAADGRLESKTIHGLVHNHGSNSSAVLDFAGTVDNGYDVIANTNTLRAEIYNAVRNEMAVSLPDVVFRRTDIATGGNPGMEAIDICADIVAAELNWDGQRRKLEIEKVLANFPTNLVGQTNQINKSAGA